MLEQPEHEREAAAALIARHPLAWIVSRGFNASVLPLLGEYDSAGRLTAVVGHCARSNPLVADFSADPLGLILFNGPAGFIPTRLVSNSDWAPTWNLAVLRLKVTVAWVPEETKALVNRLLDHLEGQAPERWSMDMLGARRDQMLSRIIGFRARVDAMKPHYKLGQDEHPETFREIVDHHPDRDLVAWMEAFAQGTAP